MNQQPAGRIFDVFIREGEPGMYWRLQNRGVTVWGDGLTWSYDGRERRKKFSEIVSLQLASGYVAKQGSIYTVQIRFRGGDSLIVFSSDDRGFPDEALTPVYSDFLRTLHAQLAKSGNREILYNAGMSEGRQAFMMVAMVLATLMFAVLPVGIFIFLEASWHVLGIIAVGIAFVWPLWTQWDHNRPRTYTPDDLPHELVP